MSALYVIQLFCCIALLHAYVGYPVWWKLFGAAYPKLPKPPLLNDEKLPAISIIVAAYNEASCIQDRVKNLLNLDYPQELIQILIESDGSDDGTADLALIASANSSHVIVSNHTERRGKIRVLNDACRRASGEILVFSDANVTFEPNAVRQLVSRFQEKSVGCVCGKLCFRVPEGSSHAATEGAYWKMETWLKEQEGSRGVLLGANGAIYAMRRSLWADCPSDTVVEDFYIPLKLLLSGEKVVFEPDAVASEEMPLKINDEFGRRIRIGAGDFQILSRCLRLLHPSYGLASWAFLSRKVLRWLGPFFLIGAFLSGALLAAAGSVAGYLIMLGWLCSITLVVLGLKDKRLPGSFGMLSTSAAHFAAMNIALLFGFFRWVFNTQTVTWKRTAR